MNNALSRCWPLLQGAWRARLWPTPSAAPVRRRWATRPWLSGHSRTISSSAARERSPCCSPMRSIRSSSGRCGPGCGCPAAIISIARKRIRPRGPRIRPARWSAWPLCTRATRSGYTETGRWRPSTRSRPLAYSARGMYLLLGQRHADRGFFAGRIEEARVYAKALTADQIRALRPAPAADLEAQAGKPLALWTFEDGTAREEMGLCKTCGLRNGARIEDGQVGARRRRRLRRRGA